MKMPIKSLAITPLLMMLLPSSGNGQDSSLFRQPPAGQLTSQLPTGALDAPLGSQPGQTPGTLLPLGTPQSQSLPNDAVYLPRASWTYQPPLPVRSFRKNDIVTIRVDEIARMLAEGGAENRKQTLFEATLSDWVALDRFRLRPAEQADGDPAVSADSNSRFRSEASVESRESLSFNIAAKIVDIRPNGNIVLEARKAIRINDNLWETTLSGICRTQDIAPDNVVLSRDLQDMEIRKEDRGHLRDGYKRGWFSRWFDRVQPF